MRRLLTCLLTLSMIAATCGPVQPAQAASADAPNAQTSLPASGENSAVTYEQKDSNTYYTQSELPLDEIAGSWHFNNYITNVTEETLTCTQIIIYHIDHGTTISESRFEPSQLYVNNMDCNFDKLVFTPGMTAFFNDNHPYVTEFDEAEYEFVFQDADGQTIRFIHDYILTGTPEDEYSDGSSTYSESCECELDTSAMSWHFNNSVTNLTDETLTCTDIVIYKKINGEKYDTFHFEPDELEVSDPAGTFADLIFTPGMTFTFNDNHPYTSEFDEMIYQFRFKTQDGTVVKFVRDYTLKAFEGQDYSEDQGKDLATLRHDAEFRIKVADGVYWVPANTLGSSDYTNAGIYQMTSEEPEVKQKQIDTLYEALQLFEIGSFTNSDDNIRITENGIDWEHHKPGYQAVLTNTGCCASDSAWLSYILRDDYDEIGYIQISQKDGSGHVMNYIRSGEWYYLIDLTHYRNDFMNTAVESGNLADYNSTDLLLGNILAVKSLKNYADYYVSLANDAPGLIIRESLDEVPPIDGVRKSDGTVAITYGNDKESALEVLYDDPSDSLILEFTTPPVQVPEGWEIAPEEHEHVYTSEITLKPTCVRAGSRTDTCTICGETIVTSIPATGKHTIVKDKAVAATLTKAGKTAGSHCSVCGTVLEKQKTIACPKTFKLSAERYTYDGKVKTPTLTVCDSNGRKLSSNSYTISYPSGRKNVGRYSYKITFKGSYSGSKTVSFTIVPKKATVGKVTVGKRYLTVKASTGASTLAASGYQIAFRKSGTSNWTYKTTTSSAYKITKLEKGRTYQIRIRAYKKTGSLTFYGDWSSIKTSSKVK